MNRKKIISGLLSLGIVLTTVTSFNSGSVKAFSGNDSGIQKQALVTSTGLVTSRLYEQNHITSGMTYDQLMSSPYLVDITSDSSPLLMKDPMSDGKIIDLSKLNLDGKIYHYKTTYDTGSSDRFIEVRRMYAEGSVVQRAISESSFIDKVQNSHHDSFLVYTMDTDKFPYLENLKNNETDPMQPTKLSNANYTYVVGTDIPLTEDTSGGTKFPTSSTNPPTPTDPSTPTTPATPYSLSTTRLAGQTRFDTSLAIAKQYTKNSSFDNVVISNGNGYADALAGSTLAKKLNAPIMLINTLDTSQSTLNYINQHLNKSGHIYLLGGTGVVPDSFKKWFIDRGYSSSNIKRLGGATREGTADAIAQEISAPNDSQVIIASEEGYADALSISPVASTKGYPILLAPHNSLPTYIKDYLTKNKPSKIYVIGGTGSINAEVYSELGKYVSDPTSIERISGQTRYDTSLAIANRFKQNTDTATLVSGVDYPDAISGSVLASQSSSPILLTDTANLANLAKLRGFIEDSKITKAYILGGTGVFPDTTITNITK